MTDTYRILGLAGRGAVADLAGEGDQDVPFLLDLSIEADDAPDFTAVIETAADALARPARTLTERAGVIAQAVLASPQVLRVEVTLQQPEVSFGVPVTALEVTLHRERAEAASPFEDRWGAPAAGVESQVPPLAVPPIAEPEPVVAQAAALGVAAATAVPLAEDTAEPAREEAPIAVDALEDPPVAPPMMPEPAAVEAVAPVAPRAIPEPVSVAAVEAEPVAPPVMPEPAAVAAVEAESVAPVAPPVNPEPAPVEAESYAPEVVAPQPAVAEPLPSLPDIAQPARAEPERSEFPAPPAFPDPAGPQPIPSAAGPGVAIPWQPVRGESRAASNEEPPAGSPSAPDFDSLVRPPGPQQAATEPAPPTPPAPFPAPVVAEAGHPMPSPDGTGEPAVPQPRDPWAPPVEQAAEPAPDAVPAAWAAPTTREQEPLSSAPSAPPAAWAPPAHAPGFGSDAPVPSHAQTNEPEPAPFEPPPVPEPPTPTLAPAPVEAPEAPELAEGPAHAGPYVPGTSPEVGYGVDAPEPLEAQSIPATPPAPWATMPPPSGAATAFAPPAAAPPEPTPYGADESDGAAQPPQPSQPLAAPVPPLVPPMPEAAAAEGIQAPPSAQAEPPQRRSTAEAPRSGFLVLSGTGKDARRGLTDAVRALRVAAGIDVGDVSPLARLVTGAGDLHSAVIAIETTLGPGDLQRAVSDVSGQVPDISVEILTLGEQVGEFDGVELPLAGAATSAAVLTPWSQLAPAAVLPGLGGGPVAVLAETAPDRDAVKWLALDWLE